LFGKLAQAAKQTELFGYSKLALKQFCWVKSQYTSHQVPQEFAPVGPAGAHKKGELNAIAASAW